MNNNIHLNYMEELLLKTEKIYSWHLSASYEWVYSNHPNPTPLKNIFTLSDCDFYLRQHVQESASPILLYDDLSLLWAAIPVVAENRQLISIHLLGPVFSSYTSDIYLHEKMDTQNMSIKSKIELFNLIEQIPVINTSVFIRYVSQFSYTLNDAPISIHDIKLQDNSSVLREDEDKQSFTSSGHTSYHYELLMLQSIKDGTPISNFAAQFSSFQIGTMCPDNPLRQKKDEAIALITLFIRTAIQSGISEETAYTCSDYYIQSIEAASTVPDVIQIIEVMYLDITNQVHELSLMQIHNPVVRECMNYLDTNYKEKLDLDELADKLGYTKYYISLRFKKETGITVSEYLTERRISYAKTVLKNPHIKIQEISDELHFSSPSHFSFVFRKYTGVTPTQYRKNAV
ncbi:MAG: AraC family transcriptional regulator [Clostridiales bacterium]|nr:AraC family transcriptional regulator [Clostridiales bacterium]